MTLAAGVNSGRMPFSPPTIYEDEKRASVYRLRSTWPYSQVTG